MKTAFNFTLKLILLLQVPVSYGSEPLGKICLNLPERGLETVKIEHICKKGDIIKLNKKYVAYLCDFKSAVVNFDEQDKYICVYLGEKRELREGSND